MRLTQQHRDVYRAILENPQTSVENLELAIHDIDKILRDLIEYKLTIKTPGTQGYQGLSPHEPLFALNNKHTRKIAALNQKTERNKADFSQLIELYDTLKTQSAHFSYEILISREQTKNICISLGKDATQSIKIMTIPPGFGVDNITSPKTNILKLLNKKVKVQKIVPTSHAVKTSIENLETAYQGNDLLMKHLNVLPLQMIIFDDKSLIVATADFQEDGKALYIDNNEEMVEIFSQLFHKYWETSLPLEANKNLKEKELRLRQNIFNLFFEGLPDKAVRMQLNISERTFRYKIEGYMRQAGAKNKAQLFVYAYTQKWHVQQ